MDRIQIKEEAKAKIKGNYVTIWKALIVVIIISGIFTGISYENQILSFIISLLVAPLEVGFTYYMLKFVRNQNPEIKDLWSQYKRFIPIVVTLFILAFAILAGIIALIIPGIIIAIGLSMTQLILADPEYNNLEYVSVLKESWRLLKGYKSDYVMFQFSFFGWMLLVVLSFGIASIYVVPYITTANTLYYERLKNLKR